MNTLIDPETMLCEKCLNLQINCFKNLSRVKLTGFLVQTTGPTVKFSSMFI